MTLLRLRPPIGPVARPRPEAFILYPLGALPGGPNTLDQVRALYERAYEDARRLVEPALPERDLLGVWN